MNSLSWLMYCARCNASYPARLAEVRWVLGRIATSLEPGDPQLPEFPCLKHGGGCRQWECEIRGSLLKILLIRCQLWVGSANALPLNLRSVGGSRMRTCSSLDMFAGGFAAPDRRFQRATERERGEIQALNTDTHTGARTQIPHARTRVHHHYRQLSASVVKQTQFICFLTTLNSI